MLELKSLCDGKNIAIVGNAESLMDKTFANEIDSHDIVIRINKGVLLTSDMMNKSHGKKCDIYTVSGVGCVDVNLHTTTMPKLSYWMTTYKREDAPEKYHFFPEEMWNKLQEDLRTESDFEVRPSTGLMTIYMIINATKYANLDIYGFDFWQTKTFYNATRKWAKAHTPSLEKVLVEKILQENTNINFIR